MAVAGENTTNDPTDLSRFYRYVLSWDYVRLLGQSKDNRVDNGNGEASGLQKVRNTYINTDDYLATFEPLLFEEVRAQITQAKDKEDATDCKLGAVVTCTEADGFHIPVVGYHADDDEMIVEHDLLLLSKEKVWEQLQGSKIPTAHAFALVLNREGRDGDIKLRLRTFLAGEVQPSLKTQAGEIRAMNLDQVKPCQRLFKMRSIFTTPDESKRGVWIQKIASLSTIVREYVALRSVSSLPFKELILSAAEKDSSTEDRSWKIPRSLMEFLESNHNASQLDAIRAGLSRKTFVLIQGPPGTGKTQTILGLLSAILHSTPARVQSKGRLRDQRSRQEIDIHEKFNHWKKASPWLYDTNLRDKIMPLDGDDGFFPTTGNELKPEVVNSNRKYRVRVLVCAPSNSALDEIVLRVLSTGVRDENGRAYNPKIVRIGVKPHHSVRAVSMDYLMEQKISSGDRDSIRASVLNEAAIVFSTLSFSGSTLFSKLKNMFDVVIIDEAAQAVESATLVPLAHGCKQVFLVGDPVQLPATVISETAKRFGYGMSLFTRLQSAGYPVLRLKTQYRMHPEIRCFPSREFYSDALEDGPDVEHQTERSWHVYSCFAPFVFFDIAEGVESRPPGSDSSWLNVEEIEFILHMYHKLVTHYPDLKSSSRLGIISPYRQQVKSLRDRFRETFGPESDTLVDINTVDGSQGREKDVVIFSCVRASETKSIGFLQDYRRMNVGITRARSSVLVVGSASTLKRGGPSSNQDGQEEVNHWANLVDHAEQRKCLFKVSKPYSSFFSDKNLETMRVKDETMFEEVESQLEDMERDAAMYGNPVPEHDPGQGDDDDNGDGDGDDGGFDE